MTQHEGIPFNPETEAQATNWGRLTDPAAHNPATFRYLVHAINPHATLNALTMALYDMKDGTTHDGSQGDQTISMYDHPERIAERVSLSMSLIDQDHIATWGEAGLLVEAPEENMVLTSESDAGTLNSMPDVLLQQAQQNRLMSGDELLRRTYPGTYNEVVAFAKRGDSEVQLKGFFYKVTASGEPRNRQLTQRIISHASRLGLPIVPIVEPSRYSKDKVHNDNDGKLAVHFNGKCYNLTGFGPRYQFVVCDDRDITNFIAPYEIEPVLDYAVAAGGITEEERTNVAGAYREADRQRQTPTAEFDEDGTFKLISYITGYGDTSTRVSIYKNGSTSRSNLVREYERNQEMMLSMSNGYGIKEKRQVDLVSSVVADQMVETATARLDDVQAEIVRQWYVERRSAIESQFSSALRSQRGIGFIEVELYEERPDLAAELKTTLLTPLSLKSELQIQPIKIPEFTITDEETWSLINGSIEKYLKKEEYFSPRTWLRLPRRPKN